jgi:hypothetical protein
MIPPPGATVAIYLHKQDAGDASAERAMGPITIVTKVGSRLPSPPFRMTLLCVGAQWPVGEVCNNIKTREPRPSGVW